MVVKIIKARKVSGEEYIWHEDEKRWIKIKEHPHFAMYFTPVDEEVEEQYLLKIKGEVVGPLGVEKLKERVISGDIKKDDPIWSVKKGVWIKAYDVNELTDLFEVADRDIEYLISVDGERMGPYPIKKIEEMVRDGLIDKSSYLYDGNKWVSLSEFGDLKELFTKPIEDLPPPLEELEESIESEDLPPPPIEEELEVEDEVTVDEEMARVGEKTVEEETKTIEDEPTEETEVVEEEEERKPWLDDLSIHKIDLTGMKSKDAYSIPTSLMDADTINYALDIYNKVTRTKRILAGFIDGIIIGLLFFIVLIVLRIFNINPLIEGPGQYHAQTLLFSISGGASLFYLLFRDAFTKNGSFGKKFAQIILINKKNRRPSGIFRSFARNLMLLIPVINIFEILIVLFSNSGRRLGDRLAGTEMIEVPHDHKPF